MAKKTWRDRIVAYLTSIGYERDYSRPQSAKYEKYYNRTRGTWYYVGHHGSIKSSLDNTLSNAVSVTQVIHERVAVYEWQQQQQRQGAQP